MVSNRRRTVSTLKSYESCKIPLRVEHPASKHLRFLFCFTFSDPPPLRKLPTSGFLTCGRIHALCAGHYCRAEKYKRDIEGFRFLSFQPLKESFPPNLPGIFRMLGQRNHSLWNFWKPGSDLNHRDRFIGCLPKSSGRFDP